MRRGVITLSVAAISLVLPVTHAAADSDREAFSVETLVTSVVPGEGRTTPNEKWTFFEDKQVIAEGVGSIGSNDYEASFDASLWGKLSPDGTEGAEWAEFTLVLVDDVVVECEGVLRVQRFVDDRYPDTSPVPYGESGTFRAECDDGVSVKGDLVGTFGYLDGAPGFVVTMIGTAR